jgi:hypothetical protein
MQWQMEIYRGHWGGSCQKCLRREDKTKILELLYSIIFMHIFTFVSIIGEVVNMLSWITVTCQNRVASKVELRHKRL